MLRDLFRKLFGARHPAEDNSPKDTSRAPLDEEKIEVTVPVQPTALPSPHHSAKYTPKKEKARLPIDLDIGFDLGTSCTKVVIGDREANRQTAIPLNRGRDLRGYLLPTRVYLKAGTYSLDPFAGGAEKSGLKIRLLGTAGKGHVDDEEVLCDLAAFSALVLRRILNWYDRNLAAKHPNREPIWHLNIGLPSPGGSDDRFAPTYRRLMRVAVALAPGDAPILYDEVARLIKTAEGVDTSWLPVVRMNTFPEAGAQLASLILSPHRPTGCLLVVDVGAGTMDISTMRIGGDVTSARCTLHVCEVAQLGVHYLFLARHGFGPDDQLTPEMLAKIPPDDGIRSLPHQGLPISPPEFVSRCKESILPVVTKYRSLLKKSHVSPAFKPWVNGLPYVLSGGGHRDPFYQNLLESQLEAWLQTVASEWADTPNAKRHRGLVNQSFPLPRSFAPREMAPHFDRFSVAHGLSLGADGLMEIGRAMDQ